MSDGTSGRARGFALPQVPEGLIDAAHLATSTPFAVIRERDGVFVAINDAYSQVIGHGREDILGMSAGDLVVWADPQEFEVLMKELQERGSVVDRLSTFVHANGERRVGRFSISALEVDGERYSVSTILDVTQERLHLAALGRRDAILEAVGYAAERFLQADWKTEIGDVLRRIGLAAKASRAHLYENGGPAGEGPWHRFEWCAPGIPPQIDNPATLDRPGLDGRDRWRSQLRSGKVVALMFSEFSDAERVELSPQGTLSFLDVPVFAAGEWWGAIGLEDCREERRWTTVEIDALRVAAGTLGAAIGWRLAERTLSEREGIYRTLVEQLAAVTYVDAFGEPFRSVYTSPQIEQLLGFTAEDWRNLDTWRGALHPDDRDRILAEDERTNRTLEPFSVEYRLITKDGRVVWIHDEARVVADEDGRPRFWSGSMFDITSLKRAEEELGRALELEREASTRLRALDDLKNTFLQAVSHDLRTPLASVLGGALTLDRDDVSLSTDESRAMVHSIATNAKKLSRLVTDLLDLDRLSRGLLEPNRAPVDLGALVRRVIKESDLLAGRRVVLEAEPMTVQLDASKVERIVENLLVNAVRHTPTEATIWVTVRSQEDGVLLVAEDDGPGVPNEFRETIFRAFERGPTPSAHAPGTGLGLALVARFAELHGGRAWVEERPGGGASFKVFLPG